MVKRQRLLLGVLAAVLVLAVGYAVFQDTSVTEVFSPGEAAAGPGESVPRIGLDRAQGRPPMGVAVGRRDIFAFATPPPPPPPPVAEYTPPPAPVAPVVTVPTPTPLPPVNVKYIGSMEQQGIKVALFMNDQKEVLSGKEGQTVMNRFKVVRIGFESVDVQEVGSGQVRRLPLRGN